MERPNFHDSVFNRDEPKLIPDDTLHFLANKKKVRKDRDSEYTDTMEEQEKDEDFGLDFPDENFKEDNFTQEYGSSSHEDSGSEYSLKDEPRNFFENMSPKKESKPSGPEMKQGGFFSKLGGMFGGNNENSDNSDTHSLSRASQSSSQKRTAPKRPKSFEEVMEEKQELLYRLERLAKAGYMPSKKFTLQTDLNEIKYEYEKLSKQRNIDKSIKMQRGVLMSVVSGAEYLNKNFNPLEFKLDGWSESIHTNIHEYDEVFEELFDKYQDKVKMMPEIKLLMMLGSSAFMFHLSKSLFKSSMPELGDILKQNPDLMANVQQAALNSMKTNVNNNGQNNMFTNMMFNGAQQSINKNKSMRGPSGVDDILSQLQSRKLGSNETTSDVEITN